MQIKHNVLIVDTTFQNILKKSDLLFNDLSMFINEDFAQICLIVLKENHAQTVQISICKAVF